MASQLFIFRASFLCSSDSKTEKKSHKSNNKNIVTLRQVSLYYLQAHGYVFASQHIHFIITEKQSNIY